MKRIKSEKEQYLQKRTVQFVRRVQALVLAGAVLLAGGFAVHAATVADIIDTQYYADKYPDLKAAFGYDSQALIQHYLTYGIKEGRDAGGLLDVRKYRETYADLDAAFGNNWNAYVDHFLTYGAFEGRNSGTDFNALDYAERYGDLKAAFGNNVLQLFRHYQTFGKNEQREARSEAVVVEEQRAAANAAASAALEERRKLYPVLTDEDGNIPDLGGMEIIIRDWWSSADGSDAYNEYETYLRDYREWAMWRYNFTIKQVGIGEWDNAYECDLFRSYVNDYERNGGDDANYIFVLWNDKPLFAAEREGLAYDLATLDCLKFDEEKWVSGVHEYHTIGNSIYAMNFNVPEPRTVMYFNKNILRDAGIDPDDIYKWQESGEWTWDKFEELCEKITRDTDGDGEIDVWALNGVEQDFYMNAVYSNNGDFIGMENGRYVNGLASSKTQEALDWALTTLDAYRAPAPQPDEVPEELFEYYYSYEWDEEANEYVYALRWDYAVPEFRQNVGAFYTTDVGTGLSNFGIDPDLRIDLWEKVPRLNRDDVGIVCFPKGPAASDYTNIYNDNAYVIPGCYDAEKAWNIAFALNAWTMPISGYDEKEAVLNSYYRDFGDTESVDLTIKRLLSNGRVTYHTAVPEIELGEDLIWSLWDNWYYNDRNIEKAVEETIQKWDRNILNAN